MFTGSLSFLSSMTFSSSTILSLPSKFTFQACILYPFSSSICYSSFSSSTFFFDLLDFTLPSEDQVQYVDMPKKFQYEQKAKKWVKRKNKSETIGRVHSVNPVAGDIFYLRLLLHNDHCLGKTSFQNLWTVNGEICDTFKEACTRLGLLQDDNEWHQVLTELDFIWSVPAV